MIDAGISNARRRAVYRRDGWRCALCDSSDGLQIHHCMPRGEGGSDFPENLITLCWRCHSAAHGVDVIGFDMPPRELEAMMQQECVEYLADFYAEEGWYPWK